jgi:hypothetical protein
MTRVIVEMKDYSFSLINLFALSLEPATQALRE